MELYNQVSNLQDKVAGLMSEKAKLQDVNFEQEIEIKHCRALNNEVSGKQLYQLSAAKEIM